MILLIYILVGNRHRGDVTREDVSHAVAFIQLWKEREREYEEVRIRDKMKLRRKLGRFNTVGDALKLREPDKWMMEDEVRVGEEQIIHCSLPNSRFGEALDHYYLKEKDETTLRKAQVFVCVYMYGSV